MKLNLFVYGTLLDSDVVQALTGKSFPITSATLPHHQRFRIHQPGRQARGPAIIRRPHAFVEGHVLHEVDPETMRLFDRFELAASGYERVTAIAHRPDDGQFVVETYRATEALAEYLWGDWSLEEFQRLFKADYLTERIPRLKQRWRQSGEISM